MVKKDKATTSLQFTPKDSRGRKQDKEQAKGRTNQGKAILWPGEQRQKLTRL